MGFGTAQQTIAKGIEARAKKKKSSKSSSKKNLGSIKGVKVFAKQKRRDGSTLFFDRNMNVIRETDSRGRSVQRIGLSPATKTSRGGGISIKKISPKILAQQRAKEFLTKKLREQVKISNNFANRITQSTDLSRIRGLTLIPIRNRQNRIVGVRDLINKQSIRGNFSSQQIAQIDRERKLFVFDKTKKITPDKFGGTVISKAEKPKTLLGKTISTQEKNIFLREKASREGKVFQAVGRGLVLSGLLGVARGLTSIQNAIFRPKETAMGLASFAKQAYRDPMGVLAAEGKRFVLDPVGVAAEYYTFSKVLGAGAKTAKQSPVGRFVSEELFIAKQPKVVRPFVRKIIKSSKLQERLNPFNIKDIKRVDFLEVKSLNKFEAQALKRALQRTDSVVFGSLASRTLSKKQTAIPKDVDLATKNIDVFNKEFINNIPKKYQKNYVSKGEKVVNKITSEALFDIKPLNRIYPSSSLFRRRKGFLPVVGYVKRVGFKKGSVLPIPRLKRVLSTGDISIPTQKTVVVDGVKLTGFGEQTVRKGLGTLQVILEKNARRAKDPQSFVNSLQVQVESLKFSKPKTAFGRLRKTSRIKNLSSAIKLLSSKRFANFLDGQVPGLTKEFPLVAKLSGAKVRKVRLFSKREVTRIAKNAGKTSLLSKSELQKVSSKKVSLKQTVTKKRVSVRSKLPSRLVKSRVPSKLPSRVPKSRVPSKLPSRTPSKTPSKAPSRVPSKLPSRVPKSRVPSKLPSRTPSKTPSKVPSRVPSKLPSRVPSRLRITRKSRLPTKLPDKVKKILRRHKKRLSNEDKKELIKFVKNSKKIYRAGLASLIFGKTGFKIPKKITPFTPRPILVKRTRLLKRKSKK